MRVTSDSITTLFSLLLLLPLSSAAAIEKRALPVLMGVADTFAAVAHTTITNSGATVVTGNLGVCPGTAVTGFPPGTCSGTITSGPTACAAETACSSAYANAKGLTPTVTLPSGIIGNGQTLVPGVYAIPTSGGTLEGTLTLNGASNSKGQYIFQFATTFMSTVGAKVVLENGAQACNVYWQVGSSATIAANTTLLGNVLAYTAIGMGAGASDKGTLCALNAAVNLDDNALTALTTCST